MHQASHTTVGRASAHGPDGTQGTLGTLQILFPPSSETPRSPLSLPRTVIFTVTAAHFSGAPFPQGYGAKSCTTPLLFFAVLVSIVVRGDWVSHSSPRSEMLGLAVCLSSKLLSEGRKGMKGRADPEPREKFFPRSLGEDVQLHSQGKGSSLPHLLGSNLDCLHRGPGWASRTPH